MQVIGKPNYVIKLLLKKCSFHAIFFIQENNNEYKKLSQQHKSIQKFSSLQNMVNL